MSKDELPARLAHQDDRFPLCSDPSRDGFTHIIAPKMTRQPGHRKFCMAQAPPAATGESAEAPESLPSQRAVTVQYKASSSHTWDGHGCSQCLTWDCTGTCCAKTELSLKFLFSWPQSYRARTCWGRISSTAIGYTLTKTFPIGRTGGTLQHRSYTGLQLSLDTSRRVLSAAAELLFFTITNPNRPHSSQLSRVANWLKLGEGYLHL